MSGANPIEQFDIQKIVPLNIAGLDFSITNSTVFMIISFLTACLFMWPRKSVGQNHVPSHFQVAQEMIFSLISGMVYESVGEKYKKYFPFIFTMFLFVLFCNLWGLIPTPMGTFAVTSHIAVTGVLALMVFFTVVGAGVANSGLGYFAHFAPKGVPAFMLVIIVPIEIISFLARPLTLAVRLCGNMTAGHIVLYIFGTFVSGLLGAGILATLGILPFVMLLAINALEFFVAFLQAYIFATLACIYLSESVDVSH